MSKPPAKPAAPAAKEEPAAPPKSKKMLIIGVTVLLLAVAGGAGWFFTKDKAPAEGAEGEHAAEAHPEPVMEAKFIALGEKFTVNLQREEGDQYLQAGITLKVLDPMLEEKIKLMMPEIRSKLLFLLSSKKPSELVTFEGKKVLVEQIIAETDSILGVAAPAAAHAPAPAQDAHGADAHAAAASAPAAPVAAPAPKKTGVVDVLFSDFIIQ